jgi:predicted alpha/beta-fold hydrolase
MRRPEPIPYVREMLATPDGDVLALDHLEPSPGAEAGPAPRGRVLLLHGLEGSSDSLVMRSMALRLWLGGMAVTSMNFRGCAPDREAPGRTLPARTPRLHNAGDQSDLEHVLRHVSALRPARTLYAAGISLGGSVLLRWLGEPHAHSLLAAAAVVSVPYDLSAGARHMESTIGRLYAWTYLRTLLPKVLDLARRFPEVGRTVDLGRVPGTASFRELDEVVTAPLHGYASAEDYYERCASLPVLGRLRTPTLCVSSADDPFLAPGVLARARQAFSRAVELVAPHRGGHVGFVSGRWPCRVRFWSEEFVTRWLLLQHRKDR